MDKTGRPPYGDYPLTLQAYEAMSGLCRKYGDKNVRAAILAGVLCREDCSAALYHDRVRLAVRLTDMPMDDPRFTAHDYADAVANYPVGVDVGKLLALDDGAFGTALGRMAQYKRETYSDEAHEFHARDVGADVWKEDGEEGQA